MALDICGRYTRSSSSGLGALGRVAGPRVRTLVVAGRGAQWTFVQAEGGEAVENTFTLGHRLLYRDLAGLEMEGVMEREAEEGEDEAGERRMERFAFQEEGPGRAARLLWTFTADWAVLNIHLTTETGTLLMAR
jgi:hypothetical protein